MDFVKNIVTGIALGLGFAIGTMVFKLLIGG